MRAVVWTADLARSGTCLVLWARVGAFPLGDLDELSRTERARAEAYDRDADRRRFVVAATLLRGAAAAHTGSPAAEVVIDRRCARCGRPHGRPRLPGTGLFASITHSGDLVGVALTCVGPVGLDAERVGERDVSRLVPHVLGAGEHAADREGFYRYWTRKEAVVKATGEGIGVGLRHVLVSRPAQLPRLLGYPGRPELPVAMADLGAADGFAAAAVVLTGDDVVFVEAWA